MNQSTYSSAAYASPGTTKECTDSQLWHQFKNGNEPAFARIFHQHYSRLYAYGMRLTASPDLVKDGIQELFITLWDSRERLGNAESIRFYLLMSLRRLLFRKRKTQQNAWSEDVPDEYAVETAFSREDDLIREQLTTEKSACLQTALRRLSPRQREIIHLKFYDNLSYQEIATITSLNYQSVRNYAHQAIAALRKQKTAFAHLIAG